MKHNSLIFFLFLVCNDVSESFTSPKVSFVTSLKTLQKNKPIAKNVLLSTPEENIEEPDIVPPSIQSKIPPPPPPKQYDALIRMATAGADQQPSETKNVPLLGEIPVDGSLVVLLPAAGIAILGFLFSFVVAFNARDEIVTSLESVNPPPPKEIVKDEGCRGLCSDQDEQLETLRGFMDGLRKDKPVVQAAVVAPVVEDVVVTPAVSQVEVETEAPVVSTE
eukprot:CAMPEP_0178956976 /NCGR_PEP_ID=MMETSP0789-20121207/10614_1 /TAXON_ID=3005 /ORGANISM="Rhizosolenia setigera, Strain CCMP 1694" /LENGTH=220 /DNA_ID=CAMNT_0020639087 /DNA_START=39 /DNA_END=701 /DNA_ORIENTATION=+